VLSPDGYTILPMRPITNARTIAIFIASQLKPNRAAVNACGGDEWRLSATVAFAKPPARERGRLQCRAASRLCQDVQA